MALLIFIITSWSFTLLHRKMLLCNYTLGFILYTQGYRAICNDINVTKIERKKTSRFTLLIVLRRGWSLARIVTSLEVYDS